MFTLFGSAGKLIQRSIRTNGGLLDYDVMKGCDEFRTISRDT
jgi:hypothetical protein